MNGLLLNIGCGAHAPDGWLNIDASPALRASRIHVLGRLVRLDPAHISPKAVYRDIVAGPALAPDSCDLIFASHVLEHLSLADARTALARIFAALKPGGIFRVIVPDLDAHVLEYLRGEDGASAAMALIRGMGIGCERPRCGLRARLREALSNSRHQWMWTEPSLRKEISRFTDSLTRRTSHTDVGDPRFLEVEQEKRHVKAICLEARK